MRVPTTGGCWAGGAACSRLRRRTGRRRTRQQQQAKMRIWGKRRECVVQMTEALGYGCEGGERGKEGCTGALALRGGMCEPLNGQGVTVLPPGR